MTENLEPCAKQTQEQGLYEEALEQFCKNKHKSKGFMRRHQSNFCETNTKARAVWGGIGAIFANYNTATSKMDEGQFDLFDWGFVWFA